MMFFNSPFNARFNRPFFNPYHMNYPPSSFNKHNSSNNIHNSKNYSHINKSTNSYNNCTSQKQISSHVDCYEDSKFKNNFCKSEKKCHDNNYEDEPQKMFSILGFDLYLDDLIILGILYFLYTEEVEDQYLYFALIMLLLS